MTKTLAKAAKPLDPPAVADIPSAQADGKNQSIVSTVTATKPAVTEKRSASNSVVPSSEDSAHLSTRPTGPTAKAPEKTVTERHRIPSSVVPASVDSANASSHPTVSTAKAAEKEVKEKKSTPSSIPPPPVKPYDQTAFTAEYVTTRSLDTGTAKHGSGIEDKSA